MDIECCSKVEENQTMEWPKVTEWEQGEAQKQRERENEYAGTSFSWFINRMLTKGSIADHIKEWKLHTLLGTAKKTVHAHAHAHIWMLCTSVYSVLLPSS